MRKISIILVLFTCLWSCKSNSQTNLNSTIDDYKEEILGIWLLESDLNSKVEFLENGTVKYYYGSELKRSEYYEITNSCDGEIISTGGFFLKSFKNNEGVFCAYIEGINFKNGGLLSLTTKNQGKVIVYKKA